MKLRRGRRLALGMTGHVGSDENQREANLAVQAPIALDNGKKLEEDISIHIFTVSSAMVGVCLTVIGLIRVVITLGKVIR